MRILAIDTSAKVTSAAIVDDSGVLALHTSNSALTHSQALMPMVDSVLKSTGLSIEDIDGFGCAVGPGSFTGLRIGIGAIKGLGFATEKPCFGVSTLEGLAENMRGFDGLVCAVMDARCNQVYHALFKSLGGKLERLCEDTALSVDELYESLALRIKNDEKSIFLVGDGSDLCYNKLNDKLPNLTMVTQQLRFQNAASIGKLAMAELCRNEKASAADLMPIYLRLPQAEREMLKKSKG